MRAPTIRIDLLASAPQCLDHLAPVWHALPKRARGSLVIPDPPALASLDGLLARATDHGISAAVGLDGPGPTQARGLVWRRGNASRRHYPSEEATAQGWATAMCGEFTAQIRRNGRGERARADTPSPSLVIPVANVPSHVHREWKTA